jgi:hypothetical protein
MSPIVNHSAATSSVPRVLGSVLFQFRSHVSSGLSVFLYLYSMS